MSRRFGLFILLLSFFWQAIAVAGQVPLLESAEEREHAVAHMHEVAHHHHEDGSVTFDDSSDSNTHVAMDGAVTNALAWGPLVLGQLLTGSDPCPAALASFLPDPTPDGLRRPPRPLL